MPETSTLTGCIKLLPEKKQRMAVNGKVDLLKSHCTAVPSSKGFYAHLNRESIITASRQGTTP